MVREQLRRLAGLDVDVVVEALPGDDPPLRLAVAHPRAVRRRRAAAGPACAGTARTEVITEDDDPCRIAHPGLRRGRPRVAGGDSGRPAVPTGPAAGRPTGRAPGAARAPAMVDGAARRHRRDYGVTRAASGRRTRGPPRPGRRGAGAARPPPGERYWTSTRRRAVRPPGRGCRGPGGSLAVEGDRAVADAAATSPTCRGPRCAGPGGPRWPARTASRCDVVVLDPPRTGASAPSSRGCRRAGPRGRRVRRLRPRGARPRLAFFAARAGG